MKSKYVKENQVYYYVESHCDIQINAVKVLEVVNTFCTVVYDLEDENVFDIPFTIFTANLYETHEKALKAIKRQLKNEIDSYKFRLNETEEKYKKVTEMLKEIK